MKAGWYLSPLGKLCEVFGDGDWIESKDQSPEGIRLIQTGNIGEGAFKDRAEKARYISEETFKRLRCTEVFEGDCLISRLPDPVGRSAILPDTGERMITAVDCTIVRFDQALCLPTFFNYYSQSTDYLTSIAKECTGTTRSRISRSNLAATPIPVPPLPEQHRIVAILDEAFQGIATAKANAEKNLQNARALFESHLQSVFTERGEGWVEKPLGNLCEFENGDRGVNYPNKSARAASGVPFINAGHMIEDGLDMENMDFISEERFDLLGAGKVRPNDILFCLRGSLGKFASVGDLSQGAIASSLVIVRPKSGILDGFVLAYFRSRLCSEMINRYRNGAAQPNLSANSLKQFVVPVPPVLEQGRIVTELERLRSETQRLESLYQQKLTALDDLRKSLLHQAFSGQL